MDQGRPWFHREALRLTAGEASAVRPAVGPALPRAAATLDRAIRAWNAACQAENAAHEGGKYVIVDATPSADPSSGAARAAIESGE